MIVLATATVHLRGLPAVLPRPASALYTLALFLYLFLKQPKADKAIFPPPALVPSKVVLSLLPLGV
jgi:hypothetical protein